VATVLIRGVCNAMSKPNLPSAQFPVPQRLDQASEAAAYKIL